MGSSDCTRKVLKSSSSADHIFNGLQTCRSGNLVLAQVPLCRKVRQYWVSRRILDATLSTIISTVRRDDPALHPDSQTGSAPICLI